MTHTIQYDAYNTVRRIRIACWIPKATDTHSEYVTLLLHRNSGSADAPRCYVIRTLPILSIGHLLLVLDCSVSTVHFPHFLQSAPQYITFPSGPRNQESISCKVRRVPPHHNDQTTSGAHTHSPIQWQRPFSPGGKSPPGPNLIVQLNPSAEDKVTLQTVSLATLTVP
jgi:hypothetical protein